MTDRNQTRFLEDKQGNLRALTELLFTTDNEDVRKYAAKTLAYLSLRNDKLKAGLLAGKGVQTLSHVACTIANLATNRACAVPLQGTRFLSRPCLTLRPLVSPPLAPPDESQELLVQDTRLFQALCALTESTTERADILRHVARGLANFALYGNCRKLCARRRENTRPCR